jgi:membrane-associated phospholipid phosphatase
VYAAGVCARQLARDKLAGIVLLAVVARGGAARAEPPAQLRPRGPALTWSCLYDGGAVPFIYGSAAIWLGFGRWGHPRDAPLWFSADEGGELRQPDTIPDLVFLADGVAIAGGLAVLGGDARWFHVKGVVQAWVTAAAVTRVTKLVVSRHRPHYSFAGDNTDSARLSFFSGDASATFAQTTYLALYLRSHAFAAARGKRALPWWEAATYAGLVAASAYVPYSRVLDDRHHGSDVVAGALVGAALGAAFVTWQERRFRRGGHELGPRAVVVPTGPGIAIAGS